MIYKHYERKEHIAYFLLIAIAFVALSRTNAATTITTNVQTDGNVILNSISSTLNFSNGWKMAQTTATTSQITVSDSGSNAVLIFDEN